MNSTWQTLKQFATTALGLVYPEVCQLCEKARATPVEGFVCAGCWRQVRFIRPPFCDRCGLPFEGQLTTAFECANCRELELHFSSARSAVAATGKVLDVIHRYKYQRALWFEPFLADLLIREAAPVLREEKWDWIVPVPLFATKEREREFNQAERLGRRLSEAVQIPVNSRLLERSEPTLTQTKLSREERAKNVQRAFSWKGGARLRGERIVLLDDVFTTGSTTNACAKVLRQAGAGEIRVWTVARGLGNQ